MLAKANIEHVMHQFTTLNKFKDYQFVKIATTQQLQDVANLRLKVYQNDLPYMLKQLDGSGFDNYDHHSLIYAIYYQNTIAASVRLTPCPFETMQYIRQEHLATFLGKHYQQSYLEWSRFLVDTSFKLRGLTTALTIYAGLDVLLSTDYTHYFGYTRENTRRIFSAFNFSNQTLAFTIPNRGNHSYLLLKGSFTDDLKEHYE